MIGGREVPALLRARVDTSDKINIVKTTTIKEGYMLISDYENSMGYITVKVFPTESSAKAASNGERILKVKVERELWI